VLVGVWEHHSNIVSRQMLAQTFGFSVRFVNVDDQYDMDWEDFDELYDEKVKVVALSQVSNVTGKIIDMKRVKERLREDTFFIVDGSQSVPHFPVNVREI
jgi:cysteine desulfurase/selenocysteine lyase